MTAMLLSLLSVTVLASENQETDSVMAVSGILRLSDDAAVQITNAATCESGTYTVRSAGAPVSAVTTTDDMVTAMRQAMVERNSHFQLRLNGTALTSDEVSALFERALAHTGVPNEGDYIRANMTHYYCSITTGTDAGGAYSLLDVTCSFISDAEMEAEVDAAVEEVLNSLNLWNASNYEKIKGVYDWITEHVEYDYDWDDPENYTGYYQHTTHAALIARKAVCQGFASLFYRLMLELDVDCRYITGLGTDITGSERHGWNIVCLDGKYYNCDPTWDRSLMGHYRYFLCTPANFAEHTRDAEYDTAQFHAAYPMAVTPYVQNAAASGQINSQLAWVLDGDTGTLTVSGTGAIPSYRFSHAPWYNYRESIRRIVVSEGVTEVGERAFYWSTNCTEVVLPESLTAIREYGFNNLRSLKTIALPSNLKIIEFCGFSECSALTSITLPDSVTTVGSNAFSNCPNLTYAKLSAGMRTVPSSMFGSDSKLRTVVLPEGITYIDDTAFINCGFSSFTLPASVTGLGTAVFSGCKSLSAFAVEEGSKTYKAVDGVLFSADGTHLICYPGAKYGSYAVPEGTKYIDYGAFRSQRYLSQVTFPSTLVEIGDYAFSYCSYLSSVTFNSNITKVGSDAFRSCTTLRNVVFENPNVNLVGYTFADCRLLSSITLPANLREIPNGLFFGCISLKSITIPSTVTKIGSSAFFDCDGLTTVTIPGTVKSIGQQAFDFCNKLETVIFEEGMQTLGWISIRNAPYLKKVVIPSSVTKIEQPSNADSYMFDDCPKVVLYVNCGSYGHNYAKNRGLAHQATHQVKPTVVPPTCVAEGYTIYACVCGANTYADNRVPATGAHTYVNGFCSVCGEKETQTVVPLGSGLAVTVTPSNYAGISKSGTEKLACAPCLVSYGEGKFAVAYLADEVNRIESESSTTIVCRVALFDPEQPGQAEYLDIAAAGQTLGGVTIGSKAPYEPNLIALENGSLLVLFNIRTSGGKYLYYSARMDPAGRAVTDYAPLTLDGREWTPANIAASYNALSDRDISTAGPTGSMVFTSKIIRHDGYYYGYCGGVASGFSGILVRSADGINWTSVMTPEAAADMAGVIECGFRFLDETVYFCMRDISSGVYHGSYDFATGEQLLKTTKIPGLTTSKPTTFLQDGRLYLIVNKDTGDDNTVGRRNTAQIYEVRPETGALTLVKQLFCADGIAYHSVVESKGTNYWCFHTDARRIEPYTQGRSNLAFMEMPALTTACDGNGILQKDRLGDFAKRGCVTSAENQWQAGAVNLSYQLPMTCFTGYDTVTVTANTAQKAYVAFFRSEMKQSGAVDYADGWTNQVILEPGESRTFQIPADAAYLYLLNNNAAGNDLFPARVQFSATVHEHVYKTVVTAPTCTEQGYTTYTCAACGDSYVADEVAAKGHTYVNGICTGCGKAEALQGSIRLRSGTLNLLDKVCIIYKCSDDLTTANAADVAERGVLLYDSAEKAAAGDPALAYETVLLTYDEAEQRYVGQTEGIDARDMGTSQFAVAYIKMVDGTMYYGTKDGAAQAPIEYSPLKYCQNKMNDPVVGTLCRAMMHYGAAAQVLQYGMTDGLMNEGFAPVAYDESVLGKTVLVTDTAVINGMRLRSATMDLKGAISYIVKYSVEDAGLAEQQLYAEYRIDAEDGAVSGEVALEPGSDGRLWATINGVPAMDLGATLTVKPYYLDENGSKVYGGELVYSGYEYVRRTLEKAENPESLKSLAKAMAMYVHYADAYGNG